ncbi:hypothetical protein CDA56_27845 [Klebsiella michiganensis]|nr:hypothetical protein [Klebsiella michiganensis]MBX4800917.1 hypothetical protein [Klebsiella michiganensis]PPA45193.1 hypothetical protein CDA56_27845 [Klebsiella michiganensis]
MLRRSWQPGSDQASASLISSRKYSLFCSKCDVVCIYPPDLYLFLFVILRTTDALAALDNPGHIDIYAPGDSHACRLPAARTI